MSLYNVVESAAKHGRSELSRIGYLDGWRGVAIFLVLLSHFTRINEVNNYGRMGVDVFFVLSGMLMAKILFVKKVPLSTFYKRRISRIIPVFFIFLSTMTILSIVFDLSNEHNNYFFNLFFIRSYWPVNPDIWHTGLPVGHLWSLNVEEHCYIFLSIITLIPIFSKRSYLPILIFGVSSIFLRYLYIRFPSIASENYHLKTEIVASFLLISSGYSLIKHKFEKFIPSWAPILAFLLAFTCYSKYTFHWSAGWTVAPFLLAFTVNHLNLTPTFFRALLNFLPLRLLGIWSFSIYLWQQPLYHYGIVGGEAFEYAGPILFIASIIIGAISFYIIENPIRRYLNNNW